MGHRKTSKRSKARTMLRLADLEQSKNAVLHSLGAASSQESYGHAIDEFIGWYCSEPRLSFNRTVVLRYRFFLEQKNLAPSTINVRLVACRSEFVTADTAGGVGVFPLDGPSIGGVGVDGASEFASQVGDRGEDAARNDLAFDLGEPDLDLVEPGRVSGREVKPDPRMLLEELADRLSFVRGKIVEDDVNLLPRRAQGYDLLQKGDELTAGMAGSGFAVDATGGGIERCI